MVSVSTDRQPEQATAMDGMGDERMTLWIGSGQVHNNEIAWHDLMLVYSKA